MKQLFSNAFLKLAVISIFLTMSYNSYATTIYANGAVSFNTTWSADTVVVNGDITVNTGVTLTINPGTQVIFHGHFKMNINGTLLAVGQENDIIHFSINDTTGFSTMTSNNGGWYGIRFFDNVSTDSSKLIYCHFSYGKSNGTGDDANGGAVFVKNFSTLIIANCVFDHNAAKNSGGGIYLKKSFALVKFNTFKSNKCASGGGVYISSGAPKVFNNTFITNFASSGGGGIFCADTTLATVNGNLIRHNMGLLGGGLGCFNANPAFNNNTVVFNKATHGGGLSCINASPVLKNNIIYSNSGSGIGTQIALMTDLSDPSFYYCDIQGGYAAFGISGTQTYTGSYLNNIALLPQFEDSVLNNYLIKQTSPCMDAGTTDTTGLKLIGVDIANKPRINMARIDIGAYERQQIESVCGNISQNTLWNADTVKLTCDIVIDNGVTLTIAPKVYIESQGHYSITVNGRIFANATLTDSIIFAPKNVSTGWAGIIYNNTSTSNDTSKFAYCRFSNVNNAAINGGAFFVTNFSKIKINSSLFNNNEALNGAGIYSFNSSISVFNSEFKYNLANDNGAAIYCDSNSNMRVTKCIIDYNQSTTGAGGIYIENAAPIIKSSILTNNTSGDGGAIICDTANAKIINCLVVNNTASNAAGIKVYRSNPSLTNNTIAFNLANTNGGGLVFIRSNPTLINNVLYNNSATNAGNQIYLNDSVSIPVFFNCDVEGDTTAMAKNGFMKFFGTYLNNIDTIPAFISSPAGAGSLFSGISANFGLDACSHLYNKGKADTNGLLLPLKDLTGNNRIYSTRIDIGAYELIKPQITLQPQDANVCAGDTAVFSVSVESSYPVTYLWQYSSTYGAIWLSAPGDNNDSIYIIIGASESLDGNYYRCVISGSCTQPANSDHGILIVSIPPTINSQPINVTICQNGTSTFTVGASGTNLHYQWQQLPPAGSWSNCTGTTATQSTFTITNTSYNLNGYKYHCIITGDCEPDTITVDVLLTVKALPTITNQPSNQSICAGQDATYTIIATGTNITFQWEESTDNGVSWHTAPGTSNAASYTLNSVTSSMSGYRYHCVITGDCTPPATSNNVTLSVNSSPSIITQPENTHVCLNSDTSIRVIATGGNLTYQWEKKSTGDLVWSNASGPTAVSAVYQIDNASMTLNGTKFRCHIQNICPPDTMSDSVQLFVHSLPTVYLGSDTSIWLYSESVVLDAGSGFSSYHWSTGETSQTITVVGTNAGIGPHLYTVTVTDNNGCTANDNVTVTVLDNTGINITESGTKINIYPNPATDLLYLDLNNNTEPVKITINNLEGREIYNSVFVTGIKQHIIDLSQTSKGVYLISITINEKTYKEKIVKL